MQNVVSRGMRCSLLASISLLQAVVQPSNAELLGPRDTGSICAIVGQASAIVGGRLFFARGAYSFDGGDTLTRQMNLYSLDLSKPFQADAYISASEYQSIPLPSGVPYSDDWQPFFYDNSSLLFYVPNTTTGDKIWTYNVSTETFQELSVKGSSNNPAVTDNGAWISNPATGQSYYTGNPSSGLARRSPSSPWLQILDSSTSNIQWLAGGGGGPLLSYAAMVYVRAGKAGILVAFGGVDPNDHTQFASSTLGAYRPMTDIFIFDIHSSTWFSVNATGAKGDSDIPEPRISFCATVSSAPDDSSFQINIYGGYNLHDAAAMNTVYVLTLPTFQWINVTSYGNSSSDARLNVGRQGPQCLMWRDAEMIVLGGIIESTSSNDVGVVNGNGCNSSHPPLLVLDTTTFEWQPQFTPNRSYSQPPAVYNVIGGDFRGLNPKKAPRGGFNDTKLDVIFSQTVPRVDQPTSFSALASSTPSTTSSASSLTASSSASTKASSANVGAIAGGVIGGIIVLVAIAGIIFICLKRKRQANKPVAYSDQFYLGGQKPELPGTSVAIPSELEVDYLEDARLYEMPDRRLHELPGDHGGFEMASTSHSPRS